MHIHFIGCGNLGKTIAKLIYDNNLATIGIVCNQSLDSSTRSVEFIGTGTPSASFANLPKADIVFIGSNDDAIPTIAKQLITQDSLKPNTIVAHFSGLVSSYAISIVKQSNCHPASIHPVRSFINPDLSIKKFNGTYCTFEGDARAKLPLVNLFNAIGGECIEISKENKPLYHAACCYAANFTTTLASMADSMLIESGIPTKQAKEISLSLMQGVIDNAHTAKTMTKALTGPIARGDIEIVKKHLSCLNNTKYFEVYKLLAQETLGIIPNNKINKDKIEKLLQ